MSTDVFQLMIEQNVRLHEHLPLLTTTEADRKTHRLQNLFERLFSFLFGDETLHGCHVLGFLDTREPGIMGFVAFTENFDIDKGIEIWKSENVDPSADVPFLHVGRPTWLKGFTASACLSKPFGNGVVAPIRTKRLLENRVVAAVTSAAIRLLLTGRAHLESDCDIAVAVDKAPVLHKRSFLMGLPFPYFDIHEEDNMSRLYHLIPDACAAARRSGRHLIFYTTPKEAKHFRTLDIIRYLQARGIQVMLINRHYRVLGNVLENILSIDGSVILRLNRETPIVDLLTCRFREKAQIHRNEVHTPAEEREILAQELWWTTLWLYSEGHLKTEEFVETAAALLECPICKTELHPHHTTEHLLLQQKMARLLSLQLVKEVQSELTFFDPIKNRRTSMICEMRSYPHALLYESLFLAGYPPYCEFVNRTVPCDMPDNEVAVGEH